MREQGEAYEVELLQQLRAFRAVLEGRLGQAVRDASLIRGELEATNILAFDDRYGAVVILWRHWQHSRRPSGDVDPILDDLDRAYRTFTRILIAQVLRLLGFESSEPGADTVPLDDHSPPLTLAHPDSWRVRLEPTPHGLRLTYHRQPHAPEPAPTPRPRGRRYIAAAPAPAPVVTHTLEFRATFDIEDRPSEARSGTVWLHPVADLKDIDDRDAYLARSTPGVSPRRPGGDTPPPSVPAAPWHYGTIDAVARLLRARFLGETLKAGEIPDDCPVCGKAGHTDGRAEDRRCSDDSCGARWGRRRCSHCNGWIPKLLPRLPRVGQDEALPAAAARQELLDTLVGADGLADLCLSEPLGDMWMVCPTCGHCGKDEATQARCPRCKGTCGRPGSR